MARTSPKVALQQCDEILKVVTELKRVKREVICKRTGLDPQIVEDRLVALRKRGLVRNIHVKSTVDYWWELGKRIDQPVPRDYQRAAPKPLLDMRDMPIAIQRMAGVFYGEQPRGRAVAIIHSQGNALAQPGRSYGVVNFDGVY